MSARPIYRHDQPTRRVPRWPLIALAVVVVAAAGFSYFDHNRARPILSRPAAHPAADQPAGGRVLGVDSVQYFTPAESETVSHANYGTGAPAITTGVQKVSFHYSSTEVDGTVITVYGRAYLPDSPGHDLPIFAFAPGTTGIGDQCAASLEDVKKANWANYDSHLITYASQGYAAVTTDYEGMRDPARLHHYMVGAVEGRAVLDSIRALEHLDQASNRLDRSKIFVAGYSQGGHAAFWADTINATYAPDIKLTGVIGYGPVLSVEETVNDVTRGSILDWFGPYVLVSYADYYHHDYHTNQILAPKFDITLQTDVLGHCVDSMYGFWGHDPAKVYTAEYLNDISSGALATNYPGWIADLQANSTGTEPTATAKRINQGRYDIVVLPSQAQAALPTMCANSQGPVDLHIYPTATHFNTMTVSLKDTLAWMKSLRDGKKVSSTCS